MPNNTTRTRDEEELLLWEVTRSYAQGNTDIKTLKETQRRHTQNLRDAVITHAKRKHKKMELTRQSSPDERERYLWSASRLYMSGEIKVDKLEEIETPHMTELKNAIFSLAKRKVIWRLRELLKIGRGQGNYTFNL